MRSKPVTNMPADQSDQLSFPQDTNMDYSWLLQSDTLQRTKDILTEL